MLLSIILTYEDVNHRVHHWTKQTNQIKHAFVFHRSCVIAYSWEGMASTSTFYVVGSCVQPILFFQDVYQLLYFSSLFLYGNRASFLTAGSCVAAAKLPIIGSCVTTLRYYFFHMLGQLGWWDVGLEIEVDVHEWWSVRIQWIWWEWMDVKWYIENGNG